MTSRSDREKIDLLLDICVTQRDGIDRLVDMLDAAKTETGMEGKRSVLENPAYQETIKQLLKQVDKQTKWLEQRKDEVTNLHRALEEKGVSRDKYRKKFAHANAVLEDISNLPNGFTGDEGDLIVAIFRKIDEYFEEDHDSTEAD